MSKKSFGLFDKLSSSTFNRRPALFISAYSSSLRLRLAAPVRQGTLPPPLYRPRKGTVRVPFRVQSPAAATQRCKIKYCFYFAILLQLIIKKSFGLFDKLLSLDLQPKAGAFLSPLIPLPCVCGWLAPSPVRQGTLPPPLYRPRKGTVRVPFRVQSPAAATKGAK